MSKKQLFLFIFCRGVLYTVKKIIHVFAWSLTAIKLIARRCNSRKYLFSSQEFV